MSHTLIVFLHGIGDNIMFSGVLKEYCRLHPDEQVDLVVLNEGCAAIWRGNPHVHSVTVYPGNQPYYWNPIKFYLLHQWTVRRFFRELNSDHRYQRILFPTIQTLPEIIYHVTGTYGGHKIERMAREMGVNPSLYPYDLYTTNDDAAAASALLAKLGLIRFAVVHPFSGHDKKRLTPEQVQELLRILRNRSLSTLIVGALSEEKQMDSRWQTSTAFGLSFGTLIELLKRAEVFAGTDSAVAHLAGFANTPLTTVFSPKPEPNRYRTISEQGRVCIIALSGDSGINPLRELQNALAATRREI